MAGEFSDYLERLLKKYTNQAINQNFQTKINTPAQTVWFINPERTQGKLADGTVVRTICTGMAANSGMGYKNADGTWSVVTPNATHVYIDFSNAAGYFIYCTPSLDEYIVKKSGDLSDYTLDIASLCPAPIDTTVVVCRFSTTGKNILIVKTDNFLNPTTFDYDMYWAFVENFTLSEGVVSGEVTSGSTTVSTDSLVTRPALPAAPTGTPTALTGSGEFTQFEYIFPSNNFHCIYSGGTSFEFPVSLIRSYAATYTRTIGAPFQANLINRNMGRFLLSVENNVSSLTGITDSVNTNTATYLAGPPISGFIYSWVNSGFRLFYRLNFQNEVIAARNTPFEDSSTGFTYIRQVGLLTNAGTGVLIPDVGQTYYGFNITDLFDNFNNPLNYMSQRPYSTTGFYTYNWFAGLGTSYKYSKDDTEYALGNNYETDIGGIYELMDWTVL